MTDEIVREYTIGEFRGDFPDVPIAEGVDIEAIKQSDPDALFVTLPIAEIGAISNNGLLYDEALVNSIEEQINAKRPGGIFGHLKEEERSTSFPLPAGLWVGATRIGQTLWAKSFIPSGAARDYIGNLKKVGGQIATSIYGRGKRVEVRNGVHRRENFKLESLDFAPPSRAALGYGAIPHVTAEMDSEQEPIMADKAQVIAELTVADVATIPIAVREAIVAEAQQESEATQTIAELNNTVTAKDAVIAELNAQVDGFRMERLNSVIDVTVAEYIDWQAADDDGKAKVKKLRELFRSQIVTRLGNAQTVERVAEIAPLAWEDLKPIAEMMRDVLTGPPARVSGRVSDTTAHKPLVDTPEAREAAMSQMGIQI